MDNTKAKIRIGESQIMSAKVLDQLKKLGNSSRAEFSLRYFKTGKGQYGEGDRFLGLNSAQQHAVVKANRDLKLGELKKLLDSPIHEARAVALLILVYQFQKRRDKRKDIFDFYISNRTRINNWDLVDCSASQIVGAHLADKNRNLLYRLARSKSLWDRRIAIISTHHFIKRGDMNDTFRIAELLLADKEDLMHKAVGWMLRETGKKDADRLQLFLKTHYSRLPRTALRYAIERFPEDLRRIFLKGEWSAG